MTVMSHMDRRKKLLLNGVIGAIVLLAIGIGAVAWLRIDPSGLHGSGLSDTFDYNLEQYQKIDPALVRYAQKTQVPVGLRAARAVAVGPQDRIFVAGDKTIRVFDRDGKPLEPIALDQEPYCLATGNAGRIEKRLSKIGVIIGRRSKGIILRINRPDNLIQGGHQSIGRMSNLVQIIGFLFGRRGRAFHQLAQQANRCEPGPKFIMEILGHPRPLLFNGLVFFNAPPFLNFISQLRGSHLNFLAQECDPYKSHSQGPRQPGSHDQSVLRRPPGRPFQHFYRSDPVYQQ